MLSERSASSASSALVRITFDIVRCPMGQCTTAPNVRECERGHPCDSPERCRWEASVPSVNAVQAATAGARVASGTMNERWIRVGDHAVRARPGPAVVPAG